MKINAFNLNKLRLRVRIPMTTIISNMKTPLTILRIFLRIEIVLLKYNSWVDQFLCHTWHTWHLFCLSWLLLAGFEPRTSMANNTAIRPIDFLDFETILKRPKDNNLYFSLELSIGLFSFTLYQSRILNKDLNGNWQWLWPLDIS